MTTPQAAISILLALLAGLLTAACISRGRESRAIDVASTVTVASMTGPAASVPLVEQVDSTQPTWRIPTSTTVPTHKVTSRSTAMPSPATATAAPTPTAGDAPVIVLDPGHVTDSSALGIEYQDNLRAAGYAKAALEEAGYIVHLTRTDNETVFLDHPELLPANAADFHPGYGRAYAHASKALEFDPDLVIVLHFNGNDDPNAGGVEVYYCEKGSEQNLVFANIVRDELVTALRSIGYEPPSARVIEDIAVARGNRHFPSLGNVYDAPRTHLGNRYANIPVVLTEPLYESNSTERALILDDATHIAIAQAYVRAADRYFGR